MQSAHESNYRDFSHVDPPEDETSPLVSTSITILKKDSSDGKGVRSTDSTDPILQLHVSDNHFPAKLHYILTEIEADGMSDIVSWQPHGRCFLVHKKDEFVEKILNHWFCQTKYPSFQRQLNLYGFRRITSGPDKNACYHELFLRGKPFLANRIQRMPVKGHRSRTDSKAVETPNFYSMPFLPPTNVPLPKTPLDDDRRSKQITALGPYKVYQNNTQSMIVSTGTGLGDAAHGSISNSFGMISNCLVPPASTPSWCVKVPVDTSRDNHVALADAMYKAESWPHPLLPSHLQQQRVEYRAALADLSRRRLAQAAVHEAVRRRRHQQEQQQLQMLMATTRSTLGENNASHGANYRRIAAAIAALNAAQQM